MTTTAYSLATEGVTHLSTMSTICSLNANFTIDRGYTNNLLTHGKI